MAERPELDGDELDAAAPRRSPTLNQDVAQLFTDIAGMLEIKGERGYRVHAYRVAARNVVRARERVDTLFAQGRLREIPGVGEGLEAKIVEYLSTGRMEYYDRLRQEVPAGLAALLRVPGLGPTRARAIYDELHLGGLADLERAARDGRLVQVPGFGDKAVENLLGNLERARQRTTRSLISVALDEAEHLQATLGALCGPERVAIAGSLRRWQETIGNIDLVAAPARGGADPVEALVNLPNVAEVLERTADACRVLIYGGLEARLHTVDPAAWGAALIWHTGARAHVDRLVGLARARGRRLTAHGLVDERSGSPLPSGDEEEVYEQLGLAWVPPELREDAGEIEAAGSGTLPKLVTLEDIKGDLHTHTNLTDGVHSLEEMAQAARDRGYQYMAVTDHSQALRMVHGLTPEQLDEQRRLVDRLNHKLAPFVVLLGTEMDILRDGRLDYPDEVLDRLDYVSASIHSAQRQSRETMTERVLRAIRNPHVQALNHPRGRLLRRREAYAVDLPAVLAAAAELGCALEVSAQPERLDLDGPWARRAREAGARLTVSSDAHSKRDLGLMPYGVGSARRGWLGAADVLNTRPLDELRLALRARS
jgi:DNA polymerase (family X)